MYWIWGISTAGMVTNGILVYFWEIKAVQDSSLYCPTVASATTIWNSSNCMDSYPTKQWTVLAFFMTIFYGLCWFAWILNLYADNKGGPFNSFFLNTFYVGILAPIGTITILLVTNSSYGTLS